MSHASSVSVIVPCRNEIRHIGRFLDSLFRQDLDGITLEVLIADGMSDDGTRELLCAAASDSPLLRIIDNPERKVSTGLNRCIQVARGEIVVRMDVHTEYARDYIRRCVEVLEETQADNVGGPALTRSEGFVARAIAAAYHSPFACGGARFHDPSYEGYVDTVTYGCWRRSIFDRIGLFDEELVRNQDDEFNLRLVRAGGTIWQSPRITSWYRPRTTFSALFRQYFQYGFWKVAVIRKHGKPASWRHLVPATFVLGCMTLLGLGGISALAGWSFVARVSTALATALIALYVLCTCAASVWVARKEGWRVLLVLPIVFGIYHVAYASGFLVALASLRGAGRAGPRMAPYVTEISR